MTTKTGKPYSKTKLEDYSGAYELALFGRDHEAFMSYMKPHESLYIEGDDWRRIFHQAGGARARQDIALRFQGQEDNASG